jgi:hypothetical protein
VVLAFVALQLLTALNPAIVELDAEEMFNAGQAWQVVQGLGPELFRMQYREFCGGCTANALIAAPLMAAFGPTWLVWKLVPIAYGAMLLAVGARALRRELGEPAALAFAALCLLPPRAALHLSLVGWGNHMEAGAVGTAGLLLLGAGPASARRAMGAGLVLGIAVWIGFSGAWAPLAALAWLGLTGQARRAPALLAGALIGVSPWALQWWTSGQHPFVTIYAEGESLPSLGRAPYKLSTLLAPRQLVALFGAPTPPLGWALGLLHAAGGAAACGLAITSGAPRAARLVGLGLLAWLGAYLVVRFQVYDPPWPEIAVPGSVRYAAPLYPLLAALTAAGAGGLWSRGRPRLAALLLAPALVSGLSARVEALAPPFPAPAVAGRDAVEWRLFRAQLSYVLRLDEHRAAFTGDLPHDAAHAYALGREGASGRLRGSGGLGGLEAPPGGPAAPAFWEGVGEALASHLQGSGADTLRLLHAAQERLREDLPAAGPADRAAALRAAATWQMFAPDPWIRAIDQHDQQTLNAVAGALAGADPEVAAAAWWAVGRTWATHVAAWALPAPTVLPAGAALPGAFVEGYGHGLGEEWGPRGQIPRPDGLPPGADAALLRGYAEGAGLGWRAPPVAPRLEP